ncbi:head maturation protease, ClpP-related [Variovorax sp. UMC13]|uniref:head maturation protease, ClpP-related n=1 Tax=Variovorax sp. UMC13 TaxID=1862326 RepID=UPI0015FF8242|nr:head maturation protease, ClpP-related [Variovorax sp. UMC13]
MSLLTLPAAPAAPAASVRAAVSSDISPKALQLWQPGVRAAAEAEDDQATISVLDPIGYDPWSGEGVTAKRISAALRSIGKNPVTVHVNSPGGDMFEGLAIYNILREHPAKVTVKVLGLAASSASIIAMAGDEIQIGRAAFLMVHNCWVMAVGNRHDLRDVAKTLEPFDAAMAGIYSARAGIDDKAAAKLMDAETWIGGAQAVDDGFADLLLAADAIGEDGGPGRGANAAHRLDVLLAKQGLPRSERRKLIQEIKGTPGAALDGTPSAAEEGMTPTHVFDLHRALARFEASTTTRTI